LSEQSAPPGRLLQGGKLIHAGKVGTGFTGRVGREIIAQLDRHRREMPPFAEVPRAGARDARWVEPVHVAEVEFTTWMRDGHIRHPSFKCMRLDKAARQVTAESAICARGKILPAGAGRVSV
jgi:bifunctional non-homologous end joining protein LigD